MKISILASLKNLDKMLQFIQEHTKNLNFEQDQLREIELACEEVLINIINYSYPETEGNVEIQCDSTEKPGIRIIFIDRGKPYNPLSSVDTVDTTSALEERKIGGYGIPLIVNFADFLDYRRENCFNILTLIKYTKQLDS